MSRSRGRFRVAERVSERCRFQVDGQQLGLGPHEGDVQGVQALGQGRGTDPLTPQAPQLALAEVDGHAHSGLFPEPESEADSGLARLAAVGRQGVQHGVPALSLGAQRSGRRGEDHERGRIQLLGQLVQQAGALDLGRHHPVQPLRGGALHETVVEHAGEVEHGREGMARVDPFR